MLEIVWEQSLEPSVFSNSRGLVIRSVEALNLLGIQRKSSIRV